ncbi:hypothetical protein SEA_NATHANVAAG_59 [Arthrobacter phage NathanVaag]|uniref:Helix-turn-helix DNA binding domain protein n=1 Tax=Arthrobacter phage Beans TaxID=2015815 RepID=A0A222ZIZ2_9CAUD|nr:DNA binding protein [Arthrobacter phage Beans]ASR84733.1 helix-turn-helix DNA binding domain protein [Arthrobacter phage Beans]UVK62311.1 hypothetical protein SEA_NATHANVAAG_59 [Arthrobacter phage NathanVaag]
MVIECTECPHVEEVSAEDPDASYSEAVDHVTRKHPGIKPQHALQLRGSEVPC